MHPIAAEDLTWQIRNGKSRVNIVDELSFVVEQGSVVGFVGPNGAGKTTTIQLLLGFIRPTSGTARIFGEDVASIASRSRIGFLPENPESYGFLKGRELLRMAGRLFGLKGDALDERIDDVLEAVDLNSAANKKIATYSRGMMQRIGVAQALINDPDLLILDEPTGGLDPLGRMGMRDIILALKSEGKTVFFSSHELSEVERICDRILLINRGRIIAQDRIEALVPAGASLEQLFLEMIADGSPNGSRT